MKIAVILVVTCLFVIGANSTAQHKPTHHVVKHSDAATHAKAGENHGAHKHVTKSGKKSKHDHEKANKGKSEVVNHKVTDEEHAGKKTKSHSSADHSAAKKSGGHSAHGAKFEEGAKHKKSGYEKGFREVYHKDEHKKHDSFYSTGHKSGDYHVFGSKNSKHHAEKFDKNSHGKHIATKSGDRYGKQMKKAGGHKSSDDKGYKHEGGSKSHYAKHEKTGKKSQQKQHDNHKYKYIPVVHH